MKIGTVIENLKADIKHKVNIIRFRRKVWKALKKNRVYVTGDVNRIVIGKSVIKNYEDLENEIEIDLKYNLQFVAVLLG